MRPTNRRYPVPCVMPRNCSLPAELAREAFGDPVVAHYVNMAQVELDAFDAAVTDWERYRCFERL